MPVHSYSFRKKTRGFNDTLDVTQAVAECLPRSGLREGLLTVFVPGSTAGITTIEYESGVVGDLQKALERLIPEGIHYDHDSRWGDGNGFSHVRASFIGPSLTVPFSGGELRLGTWQQIVLVDFDNTPRERELLVTIVGE